MAHWDTSAPLKLFLTEDDSTVFCALAAEDNAPVTAFIARHELQAAFTRSEGEGSLQRGEADRLYADFLEDISRGDIREIPAGLSRIPSAVVSAMMPPRVRIPAALSMAAGSATTPRLETETFACMSERYKEAGFLQRGHS
jgi:hypothetical protein